MSSLRSGSSQFYRVSFSIQLLCIKWFHIKLVLTSSLWSSGEPLMRTTVQKSLMLRHSCWPRSPLGCWNNIWVLRNIWAVQKSNSLWKTFRTLTACWLAGHSHSLIFTSQLWCPYGVVVIDFWHSHNNLLLGKFKFLFFLLKIFVSFRSNVLETMESDALLFIDEKTKLKEPWWDFADT